MATRQVLVHCFLFNTKSFVKHPCVTRLCLPSLQKLKKLKADREYQCVLSSSMFEREKETCVSTAG